MTMCQVLFHTLGRTSENIFFSRGVHILAACGWTLFSKGNTFCDTAQCIFRHCSFSCQFHLLLTFRMNAKPILFDSPSKIWRQFLHPTSYPLVSTPNLQPWNTLYAFSSSVLPTYVVVYFFHRMPLCYNKLSSSLDGNLKALLTAHYHWGQHLPCIR